MSEPFIVPKKEGDLHLEKLKRKNCAFPGCKVIEAMTGKGRYCQEHRKRKYRKVIDEGKVEKKKADEETNNLNQNQIIKHDFNDSVKMVLPCQLEGCQEEFTVVVYPKIFVYPKFCKEHRNEFRRELHLKRLEKENG